MLTILSENQQSLLKARDEIPMWKGIYLSTYLSEKENPILIKDAVETQRTLYNRPCQNSSDLPLAYPQFGYFPTIASLFNLIEILCFAISLGLSLGSLHIK